MEILEKFVCGKHNDDAFRVLFADNSADFKTALLGEHHV